MLISVWRQIIELSTCSLEVSKKCCTFSLCDIPPLNSPWESSSNPLLLLPSTLHSQSSRTTAFSGSLTGDDQILGRFGVGPFVWLVEEGAVPDRDEMVAIRPPWVARPELLEVCFFMHERIMLRTGRREGRQAVKVSTGATMLGLKGVLLTTNDARINLTNCPVYIR